MAEQVQTDVITPELIDEAMTHEEYRNHIDERLEQGKTTGDHDSDDMLHYTRMNVQRMNRIEKTVRLDPELKNQVKQLDVNWIWLIITEGWCGDAAQNVPVLQKIAEANDGIKSRFILRDQHLDVIDQYLTNGKSRSIPKMVCLDAETLDEIGTWGPRPEPVQDRVMEAKEEGIDKADLAVELHKWYAKDRGQMLMDEFKEKLERWS